MKTIEHIKPGAPACGLYLKIRNSKYSAGFIKNLKQICLGINSAKYEKNMHIFEYAGKIEEKNKDYIIALKELLQSQGMVFLILEDIAFAKEINADGVIIKKMADAQSARKVLGEDAIIGIRITPSVKKIEEVLKTDIDYISLSLNKKNKLTLQKLLQLWSISTDRACVIEGSVTNNNCAEFVANGASFINCSNYIAKHPKGVLQAIINMLYAIEIATPINSDNYIKH